MKNKLIIWLLILWRPVSLIHRMWNNSPPYYIHPFPFYYTKDGYEVQWYIYDVCNIVSYLMISIALWIYIKSYLTKMAEIERLFTSIVIIQIIDLIHYILYFCQSDYVLVLESLVMLFTILKNTYHGKSKAIN